MTQIWYGNLQMNYEGTLQIDGSRNEFPFILAQRRLQAFNPLLPLFLFLYCVCMFLSKPDSFYC